MSVIDAMRIQQQRKKKDEEEEKKKIVGQQPKTQPTASKPVGSSRIPEPKKETRASRNDSSRDNSTRNNPQNTSKRETPTRSNFDRTEKQKTEPRTYQTSSKNRTYQTESRSKGKDRRHDDLPGSTVNQVDDLNKYIKTSPKDYKNVEIDSRKKAEQELENSLHGNREQMTKDSIADSSPLKSTFYGAGAGALSMIGDLAKISGNLKGDGQSTSQMTPDDIYNRAMETGNNMGLLYNSNNLGNDYDAYKNYVLDRIENGSVTPDEIQKMRDLEELYIKKIPAKRLEELGEDARAINEGYKQENPVANTVGQIIPMIVGNGLLEASGVLNGLRAGANAINNPVGRAAVQQGVNLIPDFLTDTVPEALRNIGEDKPAGEVAKAAAGNLALNAAANIGFDYLPKGIKALGDNLNGSTAVKNATEEIPEQFIKNNELPGILKDAPEQVTNNIPEQIIKDNTIPGLSTQPLPEPLIPPQRVNDIDNSIPVLNGIDSDPWTQLVKGSQFNQTPAPVLNEQGQKLSKLHGTLQNTDKLTDAEKKVFADRFGFWYDPDNERLLAQQAQNEVAQDIEGVYKHYADNMDTKKLGGADAHRMFTASYDYTRLAQEATKNGDAAAAEMYTQKARNIMLTAREAATGGGQFNAAIAYYARTPQGVINKAYDYLGKQIDTFSKKNPKLSNGIDELAGNISNMLKDIDTDSIMSGTDEAAKNALRQQVLDGISEMVSTSKNKQLKNALQDLSISDMDNIINGKFEKDIAKQLDMFSMGAFGVKPETVDKVLDLFAEAEQYGINSKEYYNLEQNAYSLLANDLMNGKSFGDKVDAWRYFSMLANPQTHIRNGLGNVTNNALTGIKNSLAATIEAAADRVAKATGGAGIDRTKSILNPLKDGELIKGSALDFDNNAYRQFKQGGNKYINVQRGITAAGKPWKNKGAGKALNAVTEFNNSALDIEDVIAGKAKYQTSLAGFLKANGADASIFNATDDASRELLEQGREFAIRQANEATFHQSNAFADMWSKGVRNLRESDHTGKKIAGTALNATMPFVKTPSNILTASFAYSPMEFLKVAKETPGLLKGTVSASKYIDDISKGLTGTAGVMIGGILAREGILNVSGGDKDLDNFNEKKGRKSLSVKVGNNYIDLSQLAPAAMPLIAGAAVFETMSNKKGNDLDAALDALISGASTITDSVTDMTLLSGVSDVLKTIRYTDDSAEIGANLALKIGTNYAGQMLPTIGSKIQKTLDDTKRSTYTDKTGTATKTLSQQGKYMTTKIPGLQQLGETLEGSGNENLQAFGDILSLEPQIDSWGNEIKQQDYGKGIPGLIANNFINPLTTNTDNNDPIDSELREIYKATGDRTILNYGLTASGDAKQDGVKMPPKQWTEYQKSFGSMKHELAESLINSENYNNLDAETKLDAYSRMQKFAKAYTLNSVTGKELSSSNQALADAYNSQGASAIVNQIYGKALTAAAGINGNSKVSEAIQSDMESGNMEAAQQKIDATQQLSEYGLTAPAIAATYFRAQESEPDLTVDEFAETYNAINTDNGDSIGQDEIIDYLNDNKIPELEGPVIWNRYKKETWKKVPAYEGGQWSRSAAGNTGSTARTEKTARTETTATNPTRGNLNPRANRSQIGSELEELPTSKVDTTTTYGDGKVYDYSNSKWFKNGQAAGKTDAELMEIHRAADSSGDGKVTKAEAQAYIDAIKGLTNAEKRKMWGYVVSTTAGNPY